MAEDLVGEPLQARLKSEQLRYGINCERFHLLVDSDLSCEVVAEAACFDLPNTSSDFLGLHVSRGDLIPIYQLPFYHAKHVVPDKDKANVVVCSLVLLLGKTSNRIGIALDYVPALYDISSGKAVVGGGHLPEPFDELVSARYVQSNQWWLMFDWFLMAEKLSQR